jgi:hypothetical protein
MLAAQHQHTRHAPPPPATPLAARDTISCLLLLGARPECTALSAQRTVKSRPSRPPPPQLPGTPSSSTPAPAPAPCTMSQNLELRAALQALFFTFYVYIGSPNGPTQRPKPV